MYWIWTRDLIFRCQEGPTQSSSLHANFVSLHRGIVWLNTSRALIVYSSEWVLNKNTSKQSCGSYRAWPQFFQVSWTCRRVNVQQRTMALIVHHLQRILLSLHLYLKRFFAEMQFFFLGKKNLNREFLEFFRFPAKKFRVTILNLTFFFSPKN